MEGDRDGIGTIFAIAQEGTRGKNRFLSLKLHFFGSKLPKNFSKEISGGRKSAILALRGGQFFRAGEGPQTRTRKLRLSVPDRIKL